LKKKNPAIVKTMRAPKALNTKNPIPPTKNNIFGKIIKAIIANSKIQRMDLNVIFKSFHKMNAKIIPKIIWITI
jgi:hypothetical protein